MRTSDDFIKRFCEIESYRESPDIYNFWSACVAVSIALGRRRWIQEAEFYTVFPNLYVLFVSPPGGAKKTTCINAVGWFTRKLEKVYHTPSMVTTARLYELFEDAQQWEKLAEVDPKVRVWPGDYRRVRVASLAALPGELGSFLGDIKENDILMALIDFYDAQRIVEKGTKTQGSNKIMNSSMCLLGATTPTWLRTNCDANSFETGFASRCTFVYQERGTKLIAHPSQHVPEDFKDWRKQLLPTLKHIREMPGGPMTLSLPAYRRSQEMYEAINDDIRRAGITNAGAVNSYLTRKHIQILKLAMCISASRSDSFTIEEKELEDAFSSMTSIEETLDMVFGSVRQAFGMQSSDLIRRTLQKNPEGLSQQRLFRAVMNSVSRVDFQEGIKTLTMSDEIKVEGNLIKLTTPKLRVVK